MKNYATTIVFSVTDDNVVPSGQVEFLRWLADRIRGKLGIVAADPNLKALDDSESIWIHETSLQEAWLKKL